MKKLLLASALCILPSLAFAQATQDIGTSGTTQGCVKLESSTAGGSYTICAPPVSSAQTANPPTTSLQVNVGTGTGTDQQVLTAGSNVTITQNNGAHTVTIGATNSYSLPAATSSTLGGVIVPASPGSGTNLLVDGSGNISAPKATASQFGTVEPDNSTITASGGVLSAVGGGTNSGCVTPWNGFQSGRYYAMSQQVVANGFIPSVSTAYAAPFCANASGTITSVNIQITTTATAGNYIFAIYSDSGGKPGTVLSSTSDTALPLSFTGSLSGTFSQAITAYTHYWLVIYLNGSVAGLKAWGPVVTAGVNNGPQPVVTSIIGADSAGNAITTISGHGDGYLATGTYPTLPTSGWAPNVTSTSVPPTFSVGF